MAFAYADNIAYADGLPYGAPLFVATVTYLTGSISAPRITGGVGQ